MLMPVQSVQEAARLVGVVTVGVVGHTGLSF